jgi:hypothetical protein
MSAPEKIAQRPTTYRSTLLRLASEHCPRALDFAEAGAPYDRSQFYTGNAAHHVLQAIGERTNETGRPLTSTEAETVARATCEQLIAEGREFDGAPEPPLPPDAVFAGRDLALAYLDGHALYPGGKYEIGMAVDASWASTNYTSPQAHVRGILDRYEIVDESGEEPGARVDVHTDYKSAWNAGPDLLDSLQLKLQTLLVDAAGPGFTPGIIRRRVVNLRTGGEWHADIYPNEDDGRQTLDGWRRDIDATIRALEHRDATGRRPAAPGIGCYGCPYLLQCPEALDLMGTTDTIEDRAKQYVVASALRDALAKGLRRDTAAGAVVVNGGEVGYIAKTKRTLTDGGPSALLDRWELEQGEGRTNELLRVMGVGVTQAENVAKFLGMMGREGKSARDAFMAEITELETVAEFGWRKT